MCTYTNTHAYIRTYIHICDDIEYVLVVYVYRGIYTCIHTHTHTHTHTHIHIHTFGRRKVAPQLPGRSARCVCSAPRLQPPVFMCVCVCVCVRTERKREKERAPWLRTRIHTRTHARMYTHRHRHTQSDGHARTVSTSWVQMEEISGFTSGMAFHPRLLSRCVMSAEHRFHWCFRVVSLCMWFVRLSVVRKR